MRTLIHNLKIFSLVVLSTLVVVSQPSYASALGFQEPEPISNKQKAHFDISFTGGGDDQAPTAACNVTDVSLIGNDNAEKVWNFFLNKGFSAEQTAGIMGNFQQESRMNPKNSQNDGPNTTTMPSSGGYGLAQWDDRKPGLAAFAESQNKPIYDLGLQLNFVMFELNGPESAANTSFKKTTTIEDATIVWMTDYERPGEEEREKRLGFAKSYFEKFSASAPAPSLPTASTQSASNCGGGQYVDGFKIYSQYDPAWKDLPYGQGTTIGESGCGPAAMAMIITALTGETVTPVDTANYAALQGMSVAGGSSHSIGPVLAEHWGLKSEFVGPSIRKISHALNNGGLVIAVGNGSEPFTTGGHFIVIRGISANNQWYVGDSAHDDTSPQEWDPSTLVANMRTTGIYAIYK